MEIEAVDDNPHSPYFVNAPDFQVSALVSPELGDGNYASWRRCFELALSKKNKVGFVDGTITKPSADSRLFPAWRRCDNLVKWWIQRSVSIPIASTIFYLDTAKEVWDELQELYGEPDDDWRVFQLQQQYQGLMQGTKTVSGFYNEMLSILRELRVYRPQPRCDCGKCNCGWQKTYMDQQHKDMVFKFLNGLSKEYAALRTQLLLRTPFPTLAEAYNVVQCEEMQRNMKNEDSVVFGNPIAAMTATETRQKVAEGREVNKRVAFTEQLRFKPEFKTELTCKHCGKRGHVKSRCFYLVGFPPNFKSGRGREQVMMRNPGPNSRRAMSFASAGCGENKEHDLSSLSLTGPQVEKLMALLNVDAPCRSDTVEQPKPNNIPSQNFTGRNWTMMIALARKERGTVGCSRSNWESGSACCFSIQELH